MSVAAHLKIALADYDRRIRTFIPDYEDILKATAACVAFSRARRPTIVDLGIGTGALAARCLAVAPAGRIHGIDADPDILAMAARRIRRHGGSARHSLIQGDFLRVPLPQCDAVVATLALHHVHSPVTKRRLYARCFRSLRRGGVFASGDAMPADAPGVRGRQMASWRAHLLQSYAARRASGFFAAWSHEDTYFPLSRECAMLASAGFQVEVTWRRGPFAVLTGLKR